MPITKDRLDREKKTIRHMIGIYCRGSHKTPGTLCAECDQMMEYATRRIDLCPYRDGKPACAKCPTHCYRPAMRERVREVMRYAGPRMMLFHPVLAVLHFKDGFGRVRKEKTRKKS